MNEPKTLDEWYKLINEIYLDRNYYRSTESILAHLFEVAGGLSLFATSKQKTGVEPREFLAKSLGWWMALCGKVGIRSVEWIVWTKFPYVCPYCRLEPHKEYECKQVRQKARTIDWNALRQVAKETSDRRPRLLRDWQKMFNDIYPHNNEPFGHHYNFSRLAEELGELAEAVRLVRVSHSYFMNEAADVFAWIMGQANQAELDIREEHEIGSFLEESFRSEYPSKCRVCGSIPCKCPAIITSSIKRLSREMPREAFPDPLNQELISYEEALELFRFQEETIVLANRRVEVSLEFLEEFSKTNKDLTVFLQEQTKLQQEVKDDLVAMFSHLETLASTQQLTQASVDEALSHLKALPSEERNVLIGFLSDMGAGLWVEVILSLLRGIHP